MALSPQVHICGAEDLLAVAAPAKRSYQMVDLKEKGGIRFRGPPELSEGRACNYIKDMIKSVTEVTAAGCAGVVTPIPTR